MEQHQYAIFKTQWGWFGLLGGEQGLLRTCLPLAHKEAVQSRMLSDFPNAERSKKAFTALEKGIVAYYKGTPVEFSDINVCLAGLSGFRQHVLSVLKTISYGQIISYGKLARLADSPNAARAIGALMARNPLPLIIPCHRVINADGTPGQFSAAGGAETKKRMLALEKSL